MTKIINDQTGSIPFLSYFTGSMLILNNHFHAWLKRFQVPCVCWPPFCSFYEPLPQCNFSRIGLPNINWLGDKPYSASGVLQCCIMARMILSQIGDPSVLVLSNNSLFPLLTAVSARKLLCGWYKELTRCCPTPQLVRNSFNWIDLNCGPSSLETCSTIPYVQK